MLKLNCPFCAHNIGGVCVMRKQFVKMIDNDRNCPTFSMNEFQSSRRTEIIRRAVLWTIVLSLWITALVMYNTYC